MQYYALEEINHKESPIAGLDLVDQPKHQAVDRYGVRGTTWSLCWTWTTRNLTKRLNGLGRAFEKKCLATSLQPNGSYTQKGKHGPHHASNSVLHSSQPSSQSGRRGTWDALAHGERYLVRVSQDDRVQLVSWRGHTVFPLEKSPTGLFSVRLECRGDAIHVLPRC